jgi:hypothetical protein
MEDFEEMPKMAGWHESKLAGHRETFIPTNQLRFVERQISVSQMITHKKVLQQWWASTAKYASGEWRDVPLEQENT